LVEYHLFNEIDNILKFEDVKNYPEVEGLIEDYPAAFIQQKVESCPDIEAYRSFEMRFQAFLCMYEEKEMRYLRRHIISDIHSKLLARDFGDMYMTLNSDCESTAADVGRIGSTVGLPRSGFGPYGRRPFGGRSRMLLLPPGS